MGIEELIKVLGLEGDNAEKLRTFVTNKDGTAKLKLDKMSEKLTIVEAEKKAADAVKDKFTNLAKKIGFDAEADDLDAAVDAAIEEFKKAAGNPTPEEVAKLKKDLSAAKRESDKFAGEKTEAEKKYSEIRSKYQNGLIRQALHKALTDANANDPEFCIDGLFAKVKVSDEDDALSFTGKDGSEMEISDGIAEWAKEHPKQITNLQNGGGGSFGGGKGKDKGGINPMIQKMIDSNKASSESGKGLNDFFN